MDDHETASEGWEPELERYDDSVDLSYVDVGTLVPREGVGLTLGHVVAAPVPVGRASLIVEAADRAR